MADKYVEHDLVLVFIDIFLMRLQAYRHLLFNSNAKIARTIFLLLIAEAYCKWVLDEHSVHSQILAASGGNEVFKVPLGGSKSPLYFQAPGEWRFYYWFLISTVELVSCALIGYILLAIPNSVCFFF